MTNIVFLCRDRFRLTEQALWTLTANTPQDQYNLTIVNDASEDFRVQRLLLSHSQAANRTLLTIDKSAHVLARAKNLGVFWSRQTFGQGDWLCILDNDIAVFPGWLDKLKHVFEAVPTVPYIVGGNQHPFHGTNRDWEIFHETDAVAGYSMFMRWTTWKQFGPFTRSAAPGVGQSEDFALCRKVVEWGGTVGYVHPPVLAHCGVTNSDGKRAIGAEQFQREPGLLYE